MPVRYDIFECDEVQFQTRRRVRRLVGAIVRWRRLRRAAWCLKASRVDLVGYDYARRRCSLTHLGRDPPRGTGRRRSAH
jgi:hypothetical protein